MQILSNHNINGSKHDLLSELKFTVALRAEVLLKYLECKSIFNFHNFQIYTHVANSIVFYSFPNTIKGIYMKKIRGEMQQIG